MERAREFIVIRRDPWLVPGQLVRYEDHLVQHRRIRLERRVTTDRAHDRRVVYPEDIRGEDGGELLMHDHGERGFLGQDWDSERLGDDDTLGGREDGAHVMEPPRVCSLRGVRSHDRRHASGLTRNRRAMGCRFRITVVGQECGNIPCEIAGEKNARDEWAQVGMHDA